MKLEGCAGNGREEYANCDKDACQADILSALEAAVFGGAPAPIATLFVVPSFCPGARVPGVPRFERVQLLQ